MCHGVGMAAPKYTIAPTPRKPTERRSALTLFTRAQDSFFLLSQADGAPVDVLSRCQGKSANGIEVLLITKELLTLSTLAKKACFQMKRLYRLFQSAILLASLAILTTTSAWVISPRHAIRTTNTLLHVASKTHAPNETTYTYRTVNLYKPMGLVLEESDDNDGGVKIVSMSGAAAKASQGGIIDICIGDVVVKVGSHDCTDWSFDQIMDAIIEIDESVDLTLRRPADAVPVKFLDNGVCIAAKPGMSIGALGFMAKSEITYSCRNGGCGTCQHVMVMHGKNGKSKEQYCRPCVATVPQGMRSVSIIPCDEYQDCLLH